MPILLIYNDFRFLRFLRWNASGGSLSVTRQKVTKERVGEGFSNIPPQTPPKRHKGSCDSPCEPPKGVGDAFSGYIARPIQDDVHDVMAEFHWEV